jgi:paraquat-inducible protein B
MAKRVSSAAIGGFVAASFALIVLAIVVVASGKLFKRPVRFICMFQGDVNGLRIGAPVKIRGVQIGAVEEIKLELSPSEGQVRPDVTDFRIPVIIGIDKSMIVARGGTGEALIGAGLEKQIARGLRAQLDSESLLTGLLYIDLDLHPNAPLNLALVPNSGDMVEIPTVPTTMEAIQREATEALAKLDKIDLNGMVSSISRAANNIGELAGSSDLKATVASLKETMPNVNDTVVSLRNTLDGLRKELIPLTKSLQVSTLQANSTMKETSDTLEELQAILEPDSPFSVHLNQALTQLDDTTRSVGELTDYLQRNPAALVRGKYVPQRGESNR